VSEKSAALTGLHSHLKGKLISTGAIMMSVSFDAAQPWGKTKPTALLILADGTVIEGIGAGAEGAIEAELVFNTAMTGYQEILTDPSYLGQIVTFTFPHIGIVGTNDEDIEDLTPVARIGAAGAIFRATITTSSNYRAEKGLDTWLKARNVIGMSSVDTRALTVLLRDRGAQNCVIAHNAKGEFNIAALKARAAAWAGLEGLDLAPDAGSDQSGNWSETVWSWEGHFGKSTGDAARIVAIDYGIKRNILRLIASLGAKVTVVSPKMPAAEILAMKPDGVFLSNGPGDPAATGKYAVKITQDLVASGIPIFGICLGHQILGLALGAKTVKMHQGHHGANHPVKDHTTGKVEIVSMNHGFAVDASTLPVGVSETHVSLFDGTNCGLALDGKPVFSVQHHPEASPGPQDSHYLFVRFMNLIRARQGKEALAERVAA
jgi:carbamoyl-phosphate synthase small subunit